MPRLNHSSSKLFTTKRFLPLFITQFLEALNDNLIKNSLILLLAFEIYRNQPETANSMIAIAAGIFILPYFILSAISGQIADKFNKTTLIRIIKVFEIISMVLGAIGFAYENMTIVYISLLLLGIHSTFFGPIKYSIIPQHLKKNELIRGNAYIEGGTFLAILLGTIIGTEMPSMLHSTMFIGAMIVALMGVGLAIIGLVASFFIPPAPSADPNIKIDINIFKSTYEIVAQTRQNKRLFLVILGLSWFWLIGAVFISQFPNFAKNTLNANTNVYTLFLVLFSVGIAVGSIISERIQKGKIDARYVPIAALAISICIFILFYLTNNITYTNQQSFTTFIISPYNWLISLDIFLLAVFAGLYTVPLYTMMQYLAADNFRSRVIATNNIINALFMVVASLLIILFNQILNFSIPETMLTIGILNLLVAFYICKLLPDELLRVFFKWLLKLSYKVKIEGLENYEKAGKRVVIVANHTSLLDGLLLATFLPAKPLFAIHTDFSKKWWIKLFSPIVSLFPMDPTNPSAAKSLIRELKKNKHCVIFPEGRLTMTGALMKIYEGPGVIAERSEANILPIRIDGAIFTPFTRAKGKVNTKWFPKITIKILPHTKLTINEDLSARERRHLSSIKLYKIMTNMIFASSNYDEKLFQSLIVAKKIHGSRFKIIEDVNRNPISYSSIIKRSFILGRYISKNDPVSSNIGILLPNMIVTVISFFAVHSHGKTPVMLNFSTGSKNLLYACHTAQLKTIYTSRKFVEKSELYNCIDTLKDNGMDVLYLEDISKQITFSDKLLGIVYSTFPNFYYKKLGSSTCANDPAVILFTSGSESTPKGVALSHKNLQANRLQLASKVDFNATDIVFNVLPLFHSFGLTGGTLLPVLSGVKIFLYPSPLHYKIISALIYDTDTTILFGTDSFLNNYAKAAHPYDFYSVRYVFAGAEKLKQETQNNWNYKFGIRIFEGYGATETSPVIATNTPMDNKLGTVGKFLPFIEHKLEPVEGIENGGKLLVKGPNIMLGYLFADNPGYICAPKNGWYDTGDIVNVDHDGYITILGRVKRFAKIAGEMISLTMVENEISKVSPDKTHAVIAFVDEKKGEKLIVVSEDNSLERSKIIKHFKTHGISELAIPKQIISITTIPILGTGKTDYPHVKNFVEERLKS